VSALQIDRVARLVEQADPAQLRVLVVHQPIAVTRVEDEPNSVSLLRWGANAAPGCCRIAQWDYRADDRAFRFAKVSEVRPDRTQVRF
jgi:hypothetical protein